VHGAFDAELESDLGGLRLMLRVPEDGGAIGCIVHEDRRARDVELVASRLGLREGLQCVSPVPLQVAAFGGRVGDEDEKPVAAEDRANGMQANPGPNCSSSERPVSASSGSAAAKSFQETARRPLTA